MIALLISLNVMAGVEDYAKANLMLGVKLSLGGFTRPLLKDI